MSVTEALGSIKEVALRENKKNHAITNGVTWALYTALGAYAATQASRIHKFAPLAVTAGMCTVEMIDSRRDGVHRVKSFKTSEWGIPLPLMRGFVVVAAGLSAWKAGSLVKHAVEAGSYNLDVAKKVLIKGAPLLLGAHVITRTYRNYTKKHSSSFQCLKETFDYTRNSKPAKKTEKATFSLDENSIGIY
jgi:hypothetical protein